MEAMPLRTTSTIHHFQAIFSLSFFFLFLIQVNVGCLLVIFVVCCSCYFAFHCTAIDTNKKLHTDVLPFSDNAEFIYAGSTRTHLFYMISFDIIYKVVKMYCPYISVIFICLCICWLIRYLDG